jgi:hypothetical protein
LKTAADVFHLNPLHTDIILAAFVIGYDAALRLLV